MIWIRLKRYDFLENGDRSEMLVIDSGDFLLIEHLFELLIKVGHGLERFKKNLNYLPVKI